MGDELKGTRFENVSVFLFIELLNARNVRAFTNRLPSTALRIHSVRTIMSSIDRI